jgi:LAO/AO transport system kinase
MDLAERVLAGERLALARLLTQVENDTPTGQAALDALFPHTGRAHLVGITGAPGTGKSSLANQLTRAIRAQANAPRVGILAVDPSSPFSGGAMLGDRIRMKDASGDPEVFIRSSASRGQLGGLARTTLGMVQALDAAGYPLIFIETVGAGQSEVEIARLAHTVIVVDAPGLGDDIQALKAGILEIADLLVVNKADLPGVENTLRGLQAMLDQAFAARPNAWKPPLLRVSATTGEGIPGVMQALEEHRAHLANSGEWQRREQERITHDFQLRLHTALYQRWEAQLEPAALQGVMERLTARRISPRQAVVELLATPTG